MRIVVLCPHFAPDTAPTGTVMTRIVQELAGRGHELHVVTTLPWYRHHRIESGWSHCVVQTERTEWGTISRLHPFSGGDKRNLARRAFGFLAFSAAAGIIGLRSGGWFKRVDAVLAMSPPLTLGLTGRLVAAAHRAPFAFNIQDVFPDAAVRTGALTNRRIIAIARLLERVTYRCAAAVTVLSDDLQTNVIDKIGTANADKVHVIANFVDTDQITPLDRMTPYRRQLGLGSEPVVLYAGNLGFSQSLNLMVEAARRMPEVSFVINGDGAARTEIEDAAASIDNLVVRGYQPVERLPEVLASGDIHVVALKAGLGDVSVPSKTYSSLAAARPVVAAIDDNTAIWRLLNEAEAGIAVPPDDIEAFVAALGRLVGSPDLRAEFGRAGRAWAVENASPVAVGKAYETLLEGL